jgi:hypothetical protein
MFSPIFEEATKDLSLDVEEINTDDGANVPLVEKYNIEFLPVLIGLDGANNILFRVDGVKTKEYVKETICRYL